MIGQAESGGQIVEVILQYGLTPVVLIILAMFGWVAFKPEIERLTKENDRQHAQIEGLVRTYEERVIPVLVAANEMLTRLAEEERRRQARREWEEGRT